MQRLRMPFGNQFTNMQNPKQTLAQGSIGPKNLVHVQSIFPKDDVLALKMKTKEAHVKEALLKAVYFYLENAEEE
jgi:pyruvoyl-dependent arginine decarboxylase (PvlArgDC)